MSERLEEIRKRADQATPGPWSWDANAPVRPTWLTEDHPERLALSELVNGKVWVATAHAVTEACEGEEFKTETIVVRDGDAEFIAHAREDIPYLLARIDALEQANVGLKARLAALARASERAVEGMPNDLGNALTAARAALSDRPPAAPAPAAAPTATDGLVLGQVRPQWSNCHGCGRPLDQCQCEQAHEDAGETDIIEPCPHCGAELYDRVAYDPTRGMLPVCAMCGESVEQGAD